MKKHSNYLSRHHSIPRSRGGNDESIVMLPPKFHEAFHYLFGNLTPEEIHIFLEIILEPGTSWNKRQLAELIEDIKSECDELNDEEVQ